jgi:hypothetical protein
MDAKDFAQDLRRSVEELRTRGVDAIGSENLIAYLDTFIRDAGAANQVPAEVNLELYKAQLQKWVEDHKNIHAHSVEMFRSVIQAGQSALKTSFLMNGGAAAAILAFVGHLATTNPKKVPLLAHSLTIFVCGVLVAGIASGVTYLSQWLYAGDRPWHEKVGLALNVLAILLGLSAYGVFAWGTYAAYKVFASFGGM